MTSLLGKRKRRDSVELSTIDEVSEDETVRLARLQETLKQHFELSFAPLPDLGPVYSVDDDVSISSDDGRGSITDWDGLSESDSGAVQVVEHDVLPMSTSEESQSELKAFMVFPNIWRYNVGTH